MWVEVLQSTADACGGKLGKAVSPDKERLQAELCGSSELGGQGGLKLWQGSE